MTCGDPLCPCQDGDVCHYVDAGETKAMLISVSAHEKNLRAMRCVISMHTQITLHHCHGGSMLEARFSQPGMAERANPFYQIPIHAQYHVGEYGIDTGMGKIKSVDEWEVTFGTQVSLLHEVNLQLSYDLWQQAKAWEELR